MLQTIKSAYTVGQSYSPTLNKKGIVANVVNAITGGALGLLVLAGVMVGVSAFGTSQTVGSSARNLTDNIAILTNNFGAQLGTVGTMFGVSLIIAAIGLLGFGLAAGARNIQ